MISLAELKEYAKVRRLSLGKAEKDYFQNILLYLIYSNHGSDIVFKGGTAISKCYGSPRFSEDLDFTVRDDFDMALIDGLKRFGIDFELKEKALEREKNVRVLIKGPLYNGEKRSMCSIWLNLSLREQVLFEPQIKTIGRFMYEIPEFDVVVMDPKEILAEKFRAILTRKKARDLYDIWFLLNRGTPIDIDLVQSKLDYYGLEWNTRSILHSMKEIEPIWRTELGNLLDSVPRFKNVYKYVREGVLGAGV